MDDKEKAEELAKSLFIEAVGRANDLGDLSYWDRVNTFEKVKMICYEAANVFYGIVE